MTNRYWTSTQVDQNEQRYEIVYEGKRSKYAHVTIVNGANRVRNGTVLRRFNRVSNTVVFPRSVYGEVYCRKNSFTVLEYGSFSRRFRSQSIRFYTVYAETRLNYSYNQILIMRILKCYLCISQNDPAVLSVFFSKSSI